MDSTQDFQPGIISPIRLFATFFILKLENYNDENGDFILSNIGHIASKSNAEVVIGVSPQIALQNGWINNEQNIRYPKVDVFPYTNGDIFLHIKSEKRDDCFDFVQNVQQLRPEIREGALHVDGFLYHRDEKSGFGRDLSGFEDGTENPRKTEDRVKWTITEEGGSFCLAQKWVHHKLHNFLKLPVNTQEENIGRTKDNSEELDPLPLHSHVKRVTIEDEEGEEIKVVRQSVVYGDNNEFGLFFVSYSRSLETFDRQLRRMAGDEDGATDGLFTFSKPVTGSYFYIPSQSQLRTLSQKSSI